MHSAGARKIFQNNPTKVKPLKLGLVQSEGKLTHLTRKTDQAADFNFLSRGILLIQDPDSYLIFICLIFDNLSNHQKINQTKDPNVLKKEKYEDAVSDAVLSSIY